MAKRNIKRVDTSKHEPIRIVRGSMRAIDFGLDSKRELSDFNESSFNVASVIFSLQETCNRFGLKYDNVLVITYLNELSVFKFDISILDRNIKLTEYKSIGLIIEDFSAKQRNYYRLTDRAKGIVKFYYESLARTENRISENRVLDTGAKVSMKKALNGYFKRP